MNSLLFTIISFIAALGILITVHEFGHFWVARRLGVKVLRFSIGFGPALWSRTGKVDDTEYVVAAIPLGGYVKMLDEREGDVPEEEQSRSFNRQSLAVRTAVVVAGPLFNFLFAIFAYWLVFVSGDVGTKPVVGEVVPSSIAARAGFQVEDQVLSVAGRNTATWESMVYTLLSESAGDGDVAVVVRDAGGMEARRQLPTTELAGVMEEGDFIGSVGLRVRRPVLPAVVGELVPGEGAERSGVQSGDRVLTIAGDPVSDWNGLVEYIRKHPDQSAGITLERAGQLMELQLQIGNRKQGDQIIGRIGAGVDIPEGLFDEFKSEVKLGPLEAIGASMTKTWDMSVFMLRMLGRMVTGKASIDNLGGPISIAQTAGKSASIGAVYFLKFLAIVSISLGVLNLLPVPVLDGGHLLYFLVEGIKGSPPSEQAQILGQKFGLMALLLLMGLAFYVDISRLLG
jgi:regulator of sigma E protease